MPSKTVASFWKKNQLKLQIKFSSIPAFAEECCWKFWRKIRNLKKRLSKEKLQASICNQFEYTKNIFEVKVKLSKDNFNSPIPILQSQVYSRSSSLINQPTNQSIDLCWNVSGKEKKSSEKKFVNTSNNFGTKL